jgi:hypothetical protein
MQHVSPGSQAEFTAKNLKEAGFTAKDLKEAGVLEKVAASRRAMHQGHAILTVHAILFFNRTAGIL